MSKEAVQSAKKVDPKRLHMLVVLSIIAISHFLPPVGQMTTAGMQVFGIFIAGIYGWIFVDLLLPSLVCLIAIATTDAITLTEFIQRGLGSQAFVLIFGILFLTVYIGQINLSNVIVSWMMSRKISIGRPYVCMWFFLMACFLVATVSTALTAILLFIPLFRAVAKQANIPPYSRMTVAYFAGLGLAGCMGEICLPFKSFILITLGMLSGMEVDIAVLTMFLFPTTIFLITIYVLFCKFILRINASQYAIHDLSDFTVEASKKQILGLVFIGILLIALLLPSFLPADFYLNRFGMGGIVLLILAVMMLIHVDGEPLLDLRAVGRDLSWDIFFNCAYFVPMGSLLVSDVTGIKPTISTIFEPILTSLPPIAFIIALMVVVILLTNFLNNGPVAMIFISLALVLGDAMVGINQLALIMLVVVASFFSLATPAANAAIAFLFTQKDLIHPKDYIVHALLTLAFMGFLTVTVVYGYANIIF